jgi:glutathionylspermidine synthase
MKRHNNFFKRDNYAEEHDKIGFNYYSLPSGPNKDEYWQEGVMYVLSETEIDKIQAATQEAHLMSIEMVEKMVKSGDYPDYFALDEHSIPLIEQSWKRKDPTLYGRFDFAFGKDADGKDEIKLFEYNGDTPVSILECGVAQWNYVEQLPNLPENFAHLTNGTFPEELRIQYNLIDETLIETWQKNFDPDTLIHFAASGGFRHEDWGNLIYVMDTANRAGMRVKEIQMQDIGLTDTNLFIDKDDYEIKNCFKLYPWEWMTKELYAKDIIRTSTRWMEPAWKMLLSNKAMLVELWKMFPNHPILLAAYSEAQMAQITDGNFCKKAKHGREGANVNQVKKRFGVTVEDKLAQGSHFVGDYVDWGYIYQQWHNIQAHDGYYPIIGSWIIGDKACGMSIREDKNIVTGNDAFFASHIFVPEDYEDKYRELFE